MSDLYTRTSISKNPVLLNDVKSYLKNPPSSDDTLIQILIDGCIEYGESYTRRDFRINTWQLLIDDFKDRILLRRNPINTILSVKYLVNDILLTVPISIYYLKKGVQSSEILLKKNQSWPTDLDEIEHGIEIIFTTTAYRDLNIIKDALYRHIAHLYTNRGDCDVKSASNISGASIIYDQFRVARI